MALDVRKEHLRTDFDWADMHVTGADTDREFAGNAVAVDCNQGFRDGPDAGHAHALRSITDAGAVFGHGACTDLGQTLA